MGVAAGAKAITGGGVAAAGKTSTDCGRLRN